MTVAGLKKYLAQSRLAICKEIQTIKKLQFDKAALTYDYYASAQHTTGLFLSKYLNKNYSSITELGCGTGIFIQHLQLNQKTQALVPLMQVIP